MSPHETMLMSIGEVCASINVTRKMILNYEAKGLISPDKKEGATGNRYYTADTISTIRLIRILQHLGLSLDEIRNYLTGNTDMNVLITRMEILRDEISLNIEKLKERVKNETDFEVRLVTIPAQTVFRKTMHTTSLQDKTVILREVFMTAIKRYGSDTSKRMFFIEYPLDDPDLISYSIAILPPDKEDEDVVFLPEKKALSIFYHGGYESLPAVREKIIDYARENNLPLQGFCRHVYLEGPPQHKDPSKFITQVAILIE